MHSFREKTVNSRLFDRLRVSLGMSGLGVGGGVEFKVPLPVLTMALLLTQTFMSDFFLLTVSVSKLSNFCA